MTLLNTVLYAERALVACDSLLYYDDARLVLDESGTPVQTTKMLHLVHAGCLLAVRGSSRLLPFLYANARKFVNFDQMVSELPSVLQFAGSALGLNDRAAQYPRNELSAVGWSDKASAMAMALFAADDGFEKCPAPYMLYAGPPGQWSGVHAPEVPRAWFPKGEASADEMVRLAHAQIEQARQRDARAPYGGSLFVAEVSRHGVTTAYRGELGFPEHPLPGEERPEIRYWQIAPGAATVVQVDRNPFFAAVNVTASDVTQIGHSLTWTNPLDSNVEVQVDWSCSQIYSYAYSLMTAHRIWLEQTGAVGGATSDTITDMPSSGDAQHGLAKLFQYTVAPGATLQVQVKVRSAGPAGAAINIDAGLLRLTAIKR